MFDATTLEVFIGSANDLSDARDAVESVVRDWNSANAPSRQIMLKPVRWDFDTTPELPGTSTQDVIDRQLVDRADILVGIIGDRLGFTVTEIERFVAAKKPVLLYFYEKVPPPPETEALAQVRAFKESMQNRGLYHKFATLDEFKSRLSGDLDRMLQDFQPLLIPAADALAYGYFENFIAQAHERLRGGACIIGGNLNVTFESARILIAKPIDLDHATDTAAFNLKRQLCEESSIATLSSRRGFTVYVRKGFKSRLEQAKTSAGETAFDRLDIIDFPMPLNALRKFVENVEKGLTRASAGLGYWEKQKTSQFPDFFDYLDEKITKNSLDQGQTRVEFFDYRESDDFELPA